MGENRTAIGIIILLALMSCIILGLEKGLFEEKIDDVKTLTTIEKQEREKLKIPDIVTINFIFIEELDNPNWLGYTEFDETNYNNYFIYLLAPTNIHVVRHEIYHVYIYNKLYPRMADPEWRKNIKWTTDLTIATKDHFLAYIYGYFDLNLEF